MCNKILNFYHVMAYMCPVNSIHYCREQIIGSYAVLKLVLCIKLVAHSEVKQNTKQPETVLGLIQPPS